MTITPTYHEVCVSDQSLGILAFSVFTTGLIILIIVRIIAEQVSDRKKLEQYIATYGELQPRKDYT